MSRTAKPGCLQPLIVVVVIVDIGVVTAAGLLVRGLPQGVPVAGLLALVLLLWYGLHEKMSRRVFGGITGDLAGFYI